EAGGGGRGGQRRLSGQTGWRVAVDEAAVRRRQDRQRCAVELVLVVGCDRQRRRGDRQRAVDEGDRVIGRYQTAGGDRMTAGLDMTGCRGGRGEGQRAA